MPDCSICMCQIDCDTLCKYKIHEEDEWTESPVCLDCIGYLQQAQWKDFLSQVDKADCRASILRLCHRVPQTVHDAISFKCKQHSEQCTVSPLGSIHALMKVADNSIVPVVLEGAKTGKELQEYKEHLEKFAEYFEAEKQEENAPK